MRPSSQRLPPQPRRTWPKTFGYAVQDGSRSSHCWALLAGCPSSAGPISRSWATARPVSLLISSSAEFGRTSSRIACSFSPTVTSWRKWGPTATRCCFASSSSRQRGPMNGWPRAYLQMISPAWRPRSHRAAPRLRAERTGIRTAGRSPVDLGPRSGCFHTNESGLFASFGSRLSIGPAGADRYLRPSRRNAPAAFTIERGFARRRGRPTVCAVVAEGGPFLAQSFARHGSPVTTTVYTHRRWTEPDAPLFCTQSRRRISKRRVQSAWRTWQQRAGFDRLYPFHCTRHTSVTNVYRATRDLFLAQRIARHVSPLTTTVYTHPSDEELIGQIRRLSC